MRYEIITSQGSLGVLYDYDISLNYSVNDILDLGKASTSWSKTIILPGTSINNKFFKQIFEVNIDNISFNPKKKLPVNLKVGGDEIINGYLQLLNININNKEVEYEVNIVGELGNLFNNISDLNLSDINLSEYNHTRDKETINSSWSYDIYKNNSLTSIGGPGEGYVYPYIERGNHQDIYNTLYVDQMYPAIYVKTIIDKMINGAGYTYSSNFLNSEYFKKLIIPFNSDKLQVREEEVTELETLVGLTFDNAGITPLLTRGNGWFYTSSFNYALPFTRESGTVTNQGSDMTFRDDTNQWVGGNPSKWTCSKSGRYDIKLNTKTFPVVGSTDTSSTINAEYNKGRFQYRYQMFLLKADGTTVVLDDSTTGSNGQYGVNTFGLGTGGHTVGGPSNLKWIDYTTPLTLNMSANNVYCEVGDRIVVRVGFNYLTEVKWKGFVDKKITVGLVMAKSYGDPSTEDAYSYIKISKSNNEIDPIHSIDMNNVLDSSIKQKDFLTNIIKMFNLIITDDKDYEKNLIIEPYDDFYSSKQKVLDWDEERRLDNDSLVKITPMSEMDAKVYSYTYTEDKDFYNNEYTFETNGNIYGQYKEVVENELSDKTSEIKISFAPTVNTSLGIDNKIAPFFVNYSNEEYSPVKVKQRILFYNGLKSCNGILLKYTENDDSPLESDTYPQTGMWDDYEKPINSLEFGRANKNYFNSTYFPNQTLFEKFHKNTLKQIKDLNSKLLECTVRWTPSDMSQFDFRDIIFLNGSYWRVNEIKDYNPINSDKLTNFVLYKIIDIDVLNKYQVKVPTSNSSCPVDITTKKINFNTAIYLSDSGQNISSDCCSQLGGNLVNGVCRVINKNPKTDREKNPFSGGLPTSWREKEPLDGGPNVIPYSEPYGPIKLNKYGTTRNTATKTFGTQNYTHKKSKQNIILGNKSSINPYVKNSLVIGDGINGTESGTIFLKSAKISPEGTITKIGTYIIDGGEDTVFPFNKINPIEIIDGTVDSVRNPGGTISSRPIIDGNPYQ